MRIDTFGMFALLMLGGCSIQSSDQLPHYGLTALTANQEEIEHHLQSAKIRLDLLVLSGANDCLPSSIHTTKRQLLEGYENLQAYLLVDAANTVIMIEKHLGEIEKRLSYLKHNTHCTITTNKPATDNISMLTALDLLLNSNNQFATGEAELTDSYQKSLSSAAILLQATPYIVAQLIGHTDNVGDEKANQKLSENRVRRVKQYLLQQAVPTSQIRTRAVGEMEPVNSNNSPTAKLANRRVSAKLVVNRHQDDKQAKVVLKHWWKVIEQPTWHVKEL
jgi:outer membrane protein OmpA-like peptidoglycan-associated protein